MDNNESNSFDDSSDSFDISPIINKETQKNIQYSTKGIFKCHNPLIG